MRKEEFTRLFLTSAREAITRARERIGISLNTDQFDVEFHGAGYSGKLMHRDRAIDLVYLDEKRFYRIIDVGVKAVRKSSALLFVRISGHEPSDFAQTWNAATGGGPFKIIDSRDIRIDAKLPTEGPRETKRVLITISDPWDFVTDNGSIRTGVITDDASVPAETIAIKLDDPVEESGVVASVVFAQCRHAGVSFDDLAQGVVVPCGFSNDRDMSAGPATIAFTAGVELLPAA